MSTEIQYTLTVLTQEIENNTRKLETSLIRIMSYLQRLSGDTNIDNFLGMVQKAIITVRTLQLALTALSVASGPVGWLYAGTSAVAAGISGYTLYESMIGV